MQPGSPSGSRALRDARDLTALDNNDDVRTGADDTPITFRRSTQPTGYSTGSPARIGGMLRGLLNRDQPASDRVPSLKRPEAPSRIELPPNRIHSAAYSSALTTGSDDEEDDDAALRDGQRTPTGTDVFSSSRYSHLRPSRHRPSRVSFGTSNGARPRMRRPSMIRRVSSDLPEGKEPPPPLPGLLPQSQPESNPLPVIPLVVLCVAMLGEFLSASTAAPFMFFMIESFGVGAGDENSEAAVGFWAGIVGSVFFLSQFLTSMLWVSVAERHGRRIVLFSSLLGTAVSLSLFGMSKNLPFAIVVRCAQGLFNGAVGVARGAVQSIADPTNEARAFTYIGLCWGLGGIVGSIIGGVAESPVKNFPWLFGKSELLAEYPYLLPCLMSASVCLVGAVLSMFLDRDGGPRGGRIALPTEKDVERIGHTLVKKVSSIFKPPSDPTSPGQVQLEVPPARDSPLATEATDRLSTLSPTRARPKDGYSTSYAPLAITRTATRQSGSAYGYEPRSYRSRMFTGRSQSIAPGRAFSAAASTRFAPDYEELDRENMNFAERLLLANEGTAFGISDLWVAAATQADDQFSQIEYDSEGDGVDDESQAGIDEEGEEPDFFGYGSAPPSIDDLRGAARAQAEADAARSPPAAEPMPRTTTMDSRLSYPSKRAVSLPRERLFSHAASSRPRRDSLASSIRGPALYHNTGLASQPVMLSPTLNKTAQTENAFNSLAAIPESAASTHREPAKPEGSLIWLLPTALIAQQSLVALHGTAMDQIFMSFLVTPVPSGGLGLTAAHYAFLVALMFFFQMIWQFAFYGNVGPPRGSWSHLAMFRLGLVLYAIVYMMFPQLRGLLHESSNGFVMFGMVLLSAFRYLANTCAYTAIMVLINAMSPPHLVPLANGLAQSCVSFARFLGPLIGGIIWSASIANGPTSEPWPFNYAAGFVFASALAIIGLAHSFRLRQY